MSLRQEHDAPAITCGIKYWTANERQCQIPDENISAFRYYERRSKNLRSPQGPVCQAKRNYTESHSELWLLPSKRSDRLADCVRELDSILNSNAILHVRWAKQHKIQLMVNSGLLVNILLSEMNDIQKIFFDKSLILKTPPETGSITGAMITDKFCLLCYDEKNKLAYVSFMQRPETPELKRMTSKISSMDMKISFHDIPGTPMQRGCRKLCLNNTEDVAICWCSSHMASPPSSDPLKQERVNMILLNCSFGR